MESRFVADGSFDQFLRRLEDQYPLSGSGEFTGSSDDLISLSGPGRGSREPDQPSVIGVGPWWCVLPLMLFLSDIFMRTVRHVASATLIDAFASLAGRVWRMHECRIQFVRGRRLPGKLVNVLPAIYVAYARGRSSSSAAIICARAMS